MRPPALVALALALACTAEAPMSRDDAPAPKPAPDADAPTPAKQPVEVPRQRLEPPPVERIACESDLDCLTCPTDRCTCAAANGSCPSTETDCVADPCAEVAGSCWAGACRLHDTPAGPCARDEDCEIRADRCQCNLFAARVGAPTPERGCVGVACGRQPNPKWFHTRCDTDAGRCVLEPRRRDGATEP